MGLFSDLKVSAIDELVKYMGKSEGNLDRVISLLNLFVKDPAMKKSLDNLKTDTIFIPVIQRFKELNPNVRKKLIKNLIIGFLIQGTERRKQYEAKYGIRPPGFVLISPCMKCNLRCVGCYAGEYEQDEGLPYPVVKRVLREVREMGNTFVTISGGEPFAWPYIFKMFEDHPDIFFQVYTNGLLITDSVAKRIAKLGNVAPAISVEGFEKETTKRRGTGVYSKIMQAMANLRKYGCIFGFSATPTSISADTLATDEFVKFYIKQGCMFGWFFNYVPIGLKPDVNLMPSPEQRTKLRKKVHAWRADKNLRIFLGDFWNDGPFVKGCIAGAPQDKFFNAGYLHINHHGDVEPCGFVHFAVDNIMHKSIRAALDNKFFRALAEEKKKRIKNYLMPCCIIDNPEVLRNAVKKSGAYPTHKGADSIVKDKKIMKFLDNYSKKMMKLTKKDWNEKYRHLCGGEEIK